ncbi:hypothetical protein LZ30DRAFT_734537 [Colletotrichum cereale]|nr:hypothetical protein LZ30DRAFT_734537 [Colletotrichum cereale]
MVCFPTTLLAELILSKSAAPRCYNPYDATTLTMDDDVMGNTRLSLATNRDGALSSFTSGCLSIPRPRQHGF